MAEKTRHQNAMHRVNRIIRHPLWKGAVRQIEKAETDRIFCGHDLDHFLHVARMAYIENLERNLKLSKELIYAAALLHDIGRGLQYEQGIPHDEASCALAEGILIDCGFCERERAAVVDAISAHRDGDTAERDDLAGVLYRADKVSRPCFFCKAEEQCNWNEEKKNKELRD